MKKRTYLSLLCSFVCAASVFASSGATVAVTNLDNLTGPSASRVVPAVYLEGLLNVGFEHEEGFSKKDGQHGFASKDKAIFEREVPRLFEYSPGAWALPAKASAVASNVIVGWMTKDAYFHVLSEAQSIEVEGKTSKFFNPALFGTSDADLLSFFSKQGCRFIVGGSISDYRVDVRHGRAHGVERTSFITSVVVDLKLLDVNSRSVVFQNSARQQSVVTVPASVDTLTDVYDWERALRLAIDKAMPGLIAAMVRSPVYVAPGQPARAVVEQPLQPTPIVRPMRTASVQTIEPVEIHVDSIPQGADVRVDGLYEGNTPATLKVEPGLRSLGLDYPGHASWEETIDAHEGFSAKPTLKANEESDSYVDILNAATPDYVREPDVIVEIQSTPSN